METMSAATEIAKTPWWRSVMATSSADLVTGLDFLMTTVYEMCNDGYRSVYIDRT
jgi:hypothetical protein